jgi:hypothetical protein
LSHPYSNSFRNNNNPWPSGFSNGRFSKHSSRASQQRKPNPFRTPYRDDSDDDDDDVEVGEGNSGGGHREGGSKDKGIGITSFAPYRDDTDSDDGGAEAEADVGRRLRREPNISGEPKDESSSSNNGNGHGGNPLQNPTRIHPKMDVAPYMVFDSVSTGLPEPRLASSSTTTSTAMRVRSARPPRNPQGKMRWHDGDSSDNEDGEADVEEAIDVNALIAEQVPSFPSSCLYLSPSYFFSALSLYSPLLPLQPPFRLS